MLDVDSLIKVTRKRVFLSFWKAHYKWMALPHTSSGFTVQKLSIGYAALFPKKTPARRKRQSSNSLLSAHKPKNASTENLKQYNKIRLKKNNNT